MNHTTNGNQSEPLYCLDNLCYLLAPQDVITVAPRIVTASEGIYKVFDPESGQLSVFATKDGLDEILTCIGPREAMALRYFIFHGVEVKPKGQGKVLFRARDVANCFGYANPYGAIKKYCKSAAGGYITEADVYRLADHSRLANARRIKAWVANGGHAIKEACPGRYA